MSQLAGRTGTLIVGVAAVLSASTLHGQRAADSVRAFSLSPVAFAELGREVRMVLLGAPERQSQDRLARFVELQVLGGDVEGARESARQEGGWYLLARVASAQHRTGDHSGALETIQRGPTMIHRSQALGAIASWLPLDERLALARTIEWPRQLVEVLRVAASSLSSSDPERSAALFREAVAVAQRDTSSWGNYFDVSLAYDQARAGHFQDALRVLVDTLPAAERATRLERLIFNLQMSPVSGARPLADSLFRLALADADGLSDDSSRDQRRTFLFRQYLAYTDSAAQAVALSEARSTAERSFIVERHAAVAADRAAYGGQRAEALAAIAELEARGDFRNALITLHVQISRRLRDSLDRPLSEVQLQEIDSLADRAVDNARKLGESDADATLLGLVRQVTPRAPLVGRARAAAIADTSIRSQAMLTVAQHLLTADPPAAFAYAATIPSESARDAFLAAATTKAAAVSTDSALALARGIRSPGLRGITLLGLASAVAQRSDCQRATELAAEGLAVADPIAQSIVPALLRPLLGCGLYDAVLGWARHQAVPEARARAFSTLFEAVATR